MSSIARCNSIHDLADDMIETVKGEVKETKLSIDLRDAQLIITFHGISIRTQWMIC